MKWARLGVKVQILTLHIKSLVRDKYSADISNWDHLIHSDIIISTCVTLGWPGKLSETQFPPQEKLNESALLPKLAGSQPSSSPSVMPVVWQVWEIQAGSDSMDQVRPRKTWPSPWGIQCVSSLNASFPLPPPCYANHPYNKPQFVSIWVYYVQHEI